MVQWRASKKDKDIPTWQQLCWTRSQHRVASAVVIYRIKKPKHSPPQTSGINTLTDWKPRARYRYATKVQTGVRISDILPPVNGLYDTQHGLRVHTHTRQRQSLADWWQKISLTVNATTIHTIIAGNIEQYSHTGHVIQCDVMTPCARHVIPVNTNRRSLLDEMCIHNVGQYMSLSDTIQH